MRKSMRVLLIGVLALAAAGCGAAPEPTPYPTYTPYPEPTPYPTHTPYPEPTPYPTYTPFPEPTPYPTYTPYPELAPVLEDIRDLFCGYDFCIGHPSSAWLTDVDAPDEWSEYDVGLLTGINATGSYMSLDWLQIDEDEWSIEDEALDAANIYEAQGDVRIEQVGPLEVALVATFDAEDEDLPYGIAAAWYCGDRGFRALVFHERESRPELLMLEALGRFSCGA
jgi:hypothetical protein